MKTAAIITTVSLMSFCFVAFPIMLSSCVQRKADHMRLALVDQRCFRASKWAYVSLAVYSLLPIALLVVGLFFDKNTGWLLVVLGVIFLVLSLLSLVSLIKACVIFEDGGLQYITLTKSVRVDYSQIKSAYGSNGFITIKLLDGKGVPIQIIFEEPGKLLATIQLCASQAKQ